jgi:phosphatidylglycerol:prolipoprotein diacylglycerol transferase
MYPILIKIGEFTLHTYGLLLALAFLLAVLVAVREAKRVGIDPNIMMDLSFYALLAALVGSRVFYVITSWEEFRDNPVDIVRFWRGGLVFYGGLIFAFLAGLWYVRRHNLNFRQLADIVAPAIPLGQAVGRLGCFSAGCCYGQPADIPWAVIFTDPASLAPRGIALHPTQLYESAANFVIFLVLMAIRKKERFQGKLFWVYLLFYSVMRFMVEFYRDDPRGWVVPNTLSTAQAIGIPAALLAAYMLLRKTNPSPTVRRQK